MRTEPIVASLRGGWAMILRDPIGVLLPAAGMLLLQAAILVCAQAWWSELGTWTLIATIAGLSAARVLVASPLRASMLAAGARQVGRSFRVLGRSPALAVVWLICGGLELGIVGALLSTAAVPAWWLLARGTYWGAVLLMMTTAPAILLVGVVARTAFAYVAIEATAGRQPLDRAFGTGLRKAGRDWLPVLSILSVGELAVALGSLICGAGALPGFPLAELALLHRWSSMEERP